MGRQKKFTAEELERCYFPLSESEAKAWGWDWVEEASVAEPIAIPDLTIYSPKSEVVIDEEAELVRRHLAGDKTAFQKLVDVVMKSRIEAVARSAVACSEYTYDEAYAGAVFGLYKAVQKMDEEKMAESGAKFSTYAHPWMFKHSRPLDRKNKGRGEASCGLVFSSLAKEDGQCFDVEDKSDDCVFAEDDECVRDLVAKIIDSMDEKTQAVARLHFEQGKSPWNISKIVRCNIEKVRELIEDARELLQHELRSHVSG